MEQQTGSKLEKSISRLYIVTLLTYVHRWNVGLDGVQTGIKISGRNINNFRHADDITLMVESKEELKSLLMKEESEKADLKFNIQKLRIMASSPITS